jgi:biotin synthase
LPDHPESLPINDLMPIKGTPLAESPPLDGLEFVRMIAVARLVCPRSVVRIAAGREHMSREVQALCFLAGANSIFVGARLLTTANPGRAKDDALLAELGLRPMTAQEVEVAPG